MNEQAKPTRQKIILTPYDASLVGKISPDAEHIHILLDSSKAAFTVTLPDAAASLKRELIFKNIGANVVTIQALTGQYIDESTSHTLAHLDLVSLWSDQIDTWWMLDSNLLVEPALGNPAVDGYVLSSTVAGFRSWVGKQPLHANLTSLAGLSYASAAFVKMTGANTFTLDTIAYAPSAHGVTIGTIPVASSATGWGNSLVKQGALSIGINGTPPNLGGTTFSIHSNSDPNFFGYFYQDNTGTQFSSYDLAHYLYMPTLFYSSSTQFYSTTGNTIFGQIGGFPWLTLKTGGDGDRSLGAEFLCNHNNTTPSLLIDNNKGYATCFPSIQFRIQYGVDAGKIYAGFTETGGPGGYDNSAINFQVPSGSSATFIDGFKIRGGASNGDAARIYIPGLTAGGIVKAAAGTGLLSAAALTAAECGAIFSGSTDNYLQKKSGSNLVNSLIRDDGTYTAIGTAPGSPYKLNVNGAIFSTGSIFADITSHTTHTLQLYRGTQGSDASMPTTIGSPYMRFGNQENLVNGVQTIGFGYAGGNYQPAEIGFQFTSTTGNTKGDLIFATRTGTTDVAATEAMRITSDKKIGIGTVAPDSTVDIHGASGAGSLNVDGNVRIGGNLKTSLGTGTVMSDASGNLTSVSDARLKNVKGKFTKGLSELLKINPVLYTWNKQSKLDTVAVNAGFIAQEVLQAGISEATPKNKDGYYSFSDRAMIATLVNAIKEQQTEIQELKNQVRVLVDNMPISGMHNWKSK